MLDFMYTRRKIDECRRSIIAMAAIAALGCGSVAHAAMVSETIFFNITGFTQTQGTPLNQPLPTASVSGGVAFTYDDSIITSQQDSTANNPSVFEYAVNLTINNAQPGGTPQIYTTSEVMISLLVSTHTFSLKDTLGAMHGGEANTDGFNFLFQPFDDLVNIAYLFGNYTVSTGEAGSGSLRPVQPPPFWVTKLRPSRCRHHWRHSSPVGPYS